jgi:hypothetical protein
VEGGGSLGVVGGGSLSFLKRQSHVCDGFPSPSKLNLRSQATTKHDLVDDFLSFPLSLSLFLPSPTRVDILMIFPLLHHETWKIYIFLF